MTVKDILKLIESVGPTDTAELDEIDARVADFIGLRYAPVEYTRSRDALKGIRPEKVSVTITAFLPMKHGACTANYWRDPNPKLFSEHWTFTSPELPTEELAELHAILQALEWEKTNGQ